MSLRNYIATFAALMILLAVTVVAGYIDMGVMNLPVAMAISVSKTLLIILFFMHVRHGTRLTWIFAGAGFFWLMLLLGLAMSDYGTRGWMPSPHF